MEEPRLVTHSAADGHWAMPTVCLLEITVLWTFRFLCEQVLSVLGYSLRNEIAGMYGNSNLEVTVSSFSRIGAVYQQHCMRVPIGSHPFILAPILFNFA